MGDSKGHWKQEPGRDRQFEKSQAAPGPLQREDRISSRKDEAEVPVLCRDQTQ